MSRIGLPAERMDDCALLAGLASSSPDSGLAFVRRFQRHVFGVALAVVGDAGLAEDVSQQAFERAWRRAASFDPDRGSVRAWLGMITHNLAIDSVRYRKPTPVDPADLVRLLGPGPDEPDVRAVRAEGDRELLAALKGLPPEQARAVVMAGVYGMTAREVAASEGIPLGTAKTRIRSAMSKLRAALHPEGASRG
ncbi:MAG: RNA polymerase sigma factor [Acidimicrobiales bacterium]